ncbi:hypothetical protein Dimus_028422 [Dionaea muscipula]
MDDDQHHHGFRRPEQDIIPGLPHEIALECLLRVPFQFHSVAKSVCHDWRLLLSHPSLILRQRHRLGLSEHLLFLIQPQFSPSEENDTKYEKEEEEEVESQTRLRTDHHGPPQHGLSIYNATARKWSRIAIKDESGSPITVPMFCQCVVLPESGKVLLIGGWDPATLEPVPDVYVIDLVSGRWRKGARMLAARSFFACAAASGGSAVYVAGGHDGLKNALRSAEVYDVGKDEWRAMPAMAEERDECQGVAWREEGEFSSRFWVISGYGTDSQGQFRADAECYDPETGIWTRFEALWPFPRTSPRTTAASASSGGGRQWWWLDGEAREMRGFDWDEQSWKTATKTSLLNEAEGSWVLVSCGGDRMFAMGSGGGGGDGAVMIESDGKGGWGHPQPIHIACGLFGLPFSAGSLFI